MRIRVCCSAGGADRSLCLPGTGAARSRRWSALGGPDPGAHRMGKTEACSGARATWPRSASTRLIPRPVPSPSRARRATAEWVGEGNRIYLPANSLSESGWCGRCYACSRPGPSERAQFVTGHLASTRRDSTLSLDPPTRQVAERPLSRSGRRRNRAGPWRSVDGTGDWGLSLSWAAPVLLQNLAVLYALPCPSSEVASGGPPRKLQGACGMTVSFPGALGRARLHRQSRS
jgi:hypothetical protein